MFFNLWVLLFVSKTVLFEDPGRPSQKKQPSELTDGKYRQTATFIRVISGQRWSNLIRDKKKKKNLTKGWFYISWSSTSSLGLKTTLFVYGPVFGGSKITQWNGQIWRHALHLVISCCIFCYLGNFVATYVSTPKKCILELNIVLFSMNACFSWNGNGRISTFGCDQFLDHRNWSFNQPKADGWDFG